MIRALRRLLPSPSSTRGKLTIGAFLTTFLILVGSTAGYAYWTASNTATGTVDSADLTISTTNLTTATFTNDALASVGSISARNSTTTTSTQTATITVTLTASGSSSLLNNVQRQVWTTTDPTTCASQTASGSLTAWGTTQTLTASNIAPSGYAYWCVRSSMTNAQRDNVAVAYNATAPSMTPLVTGTINLGSFSGTATATSTQTTSRIFTAFAPDTTFWNFLRPANTSSGYPTYCLDASGGGNSTSGTQAISFGCKTSGDVNQEWKFTATSAGSTTYNIQPRNSSNNLRLDNGGSTAAGVALTLNTSTGGTSQQWELQQTGASSYGFVNALSGLCMTSPSGTGQNLTAMLQQPCDGSIYQQFVVSQVLQSYACKVTGNNFVWTWTTAAVSPVETYSIVDSNGTKLGNATTSTSNGITTSTFTYPTSSYSANALGFVDGTGTNVATGAMTRSGSIFFGYTYGCSMSDML